MKNHLRDKVIVEEMSFNEKLNENEYIQTNHKPNLVAENCMNVSNIFT